MAAADRKHRRHRPYYGDYYKSLRKHIIPVSLLAGLPLCALYLLLGTAGLVIGIPLALAVLLYAALEIVRQVSLITGHHYQSGIQQVQSLQAIHQILKPDFPLPSMARWAGNPDFCQLILEKILISRPGVVLELGSGASTIIAGLALRQTGGKLVSIDHDDSFLAETASHVEKQQLSDVVSLHHCPLTRITLGQESYRWYDLSQPADLPDIDILIVDGPPGRLEKHARYPALPVLYDRLAPNALVILDDARRMDEVEIVKRWTQTYGDLAARFIETEKGAFLITRG